MVRREKERLGAICVRLGLIKMGSVFSGRQRQIDRAFDQFGSSSDTLDFLASERASVQKGANCHTSHHPDRQEIELTPNFRTQG